MCYGVRACSTTTHSSSTKLGKLAVSRVSSSAFGLSMNESFPAQSPGPQAWRVCMLIILTYTCCNINVPYYECIQYALAFSFKNTKLLDRAMTAC